MHDGTTLTDAIRQWPTPRTPSGGSETAKRKQELGRAKSGGGDLQSEVRSWPTATARDWKDGDPSPNVPTNGLLGRAVPRDPMSHPGVLSAAWTEGLMGFPLNWTGLTD